MQRMLFCLCLTALVSPPGNVLAADSGNPNRLRNSLDPITSIQPVSTPVERKLATTDPEDYRWSSMGAGLNARVNSITVFNNQPVAAGYFTMSGTTEVAHIAMWDGSAWLPVGAGTDTYVNVVATYDGKLIAGGPFSQAGGSDANGIAAWDGNSWSPLGTGINGEVWALTVFDNKLVAAGSFSRAGGVDVVNVAAWDGSSWSPVGDGIQDLSMPGWPRGIMALTSFNTRLIAGGRFNSIMVPYPYQYAANWDGGSWTDMRAGAPAPVVALASYNGLLVAGSSSVVAWDGTSWSPLGGANSLAMYVNALTVFDGRLCAGGERGNYVASWNGSSWSPMGSGTNNYVWALGTYNDQLIVGGDFTSAGNQTCDHIAIWNKGCCQGTRGNVNMAGIIDGADIAALVSYLTGGGFVPSCNDAANVNSNGIVDSSDLAALISNLTQGGYQLPVCP